MAPPTHALSAADFTSAEHKDLQASCMAVDPTGQFAVLAGRRYLGLIPLDSPSDVMVKKSRAGKWDSSVAQWRPSQGPSQTFALSCNGVAELWDISSDYSRIEQTALLEGHSRNITDLDWCLKEEFLLATCSIDANIFLWDIRDNRRPVVGFQAISSATQVKFSPLNSYYVASSHDGDLRIWDSRNPSLPLHYVAAHLSTIHGLEWSAAMPSHIITASQDCTVKFFSASEPKKAQSTLNLTTPVYRAPHTPFGSGLVTVLISHLRRSDNSLLLWNIFDLSQPAFTFVGHTDVVLSVAWKRPTPTDPDYHLVTWSKDSTLRMWKVDSAMRLKCGEGEDERRRDSVFETSFSNIFSPTLSTSVDACLDPERRSIGSGMEIPLGQGETVGAAVWSGSRVASPKVSSSGTPSTLSTASVPTPNSGIETTRGDIHNANFRLGMTPKSSLRGPGPSQATAGDSSLQARRGSVGESTFDLLRRSSSSSTSSSASGRPVNTLKQEFSLLNLGGLDAELKDMNWEARRCVFSFHLNPSQCGVDSESSKDSKLCLDIETSFPDEYPFQCAPIFRILSPTSSVAGPSPSAKQSLTRASGKRRRALESDSNLINLPNEIKETILQILKGTAEKHVRKNRICVESCLRHLGSYLLEAQRVWRQNLVPFFTPDLLRDAPDDTEDSFHRTLSLGSLALERRPGLDSLTFHAQPSEDIASAAALSPRLQVQPDIVHRATWSGGAVPSGKRSRRGPFTSYAYRFGNFQDSNIPLPRPCGARFCAGGFLVCFGSPGSLERFGLADGAIPRSLAALGGYLVAADEQTHPEISYGAPSVLVGNEARADVGAASKKAEVKETQEEKLAFRDEEQYWMSEGDHLENHRHHQRATFTQEDQEMWGRVIVYDAVSLLPVSKELAVKYRMNFAVDPLGACRHNMRVAANLGKKRLVRVWKLASQIVSYTLFKSRNETDPLWTAIHPNCVSTDPFGRDLVKELLQHLVRHKDIQTAAMLCCAFSPPRHQRRSSSISEDGSRRQSLVNENGVASGQAASSFRTLGPPSLVRQNRSDLYAGQRRRADSNARRPGSSLSTSETSSSGYHTIHGPSGWAGSRGDVNLVSSRFGGSSETYPRSADDSHLNHNGPSLNHVDEEAALRHRRRADQSGFPRRSSTVLTTKKDWLILDPKDAAFHYQIRASYADILYRWNMLTTRAEVLKGTQNWDGSVCRSYEFFCNSLCPSCSKTGKSGSCRSDGGGCIPKCVICKLDVKGQGMFCMSCFHGGHFVHFGYWFFAGNEFCPTGCGCHCVEEMSQGTFRI